MKQKEQIAKLLLEIKAVEINVKKPFRFASGIESPIYCDNRIIISYPQHRDFLISCFLHEIKNQNWVCDVIAGTATAGIPHAAILADRLKKPMIYVRAQAKAHGKQNQIEGILKPMQNVLLIEDLISTGQSALTCAQAIQNQKGNMVGCLAIFNYQMRKATEAFNLAKIPLISLCDLETLLTVALQENILNDTEKNIVLQWRKNQ